LSNNFLTKIRSCVKTVYKQKHHTTHTKTTNTTKTTTKHIHNKNKKNNTPHHKHNNHKKNPPNKNTQTKIKMSTNGNGACDISRVLNINQNTTITALKKQKKPPNKHKSKIHKLNQNHQNTPLK